MQWKQASTSRIAHRAWLGWLGGLLLLVGLLTGCDELRVATPTAVVPPAGPPLTATVRPPSATPAPSTATVPLPTATAPEDTPTLPPADTPTPEPPADGSTPTPTFPPNPPAVEALLEDSYARMAALPGYYFTATITVNDFGRMIRTRLDGAYVRPDRLRWTTRVDESTTEGIIIGPDYYVSQDGDSWLQVPGAEAALKQYQLWTMLHDAVNAAVSPRDDPASPLTRLGFDLEAAHLPLPPQSEPWRVLSVGVWIGREDHLLYRLDLAAQTANYLLEEHMYFSGFGAVVDIQPPAEDGGPPTEEPTLDYVTPEPEPTPYGGRDFNPFTAPGPGAQPLTQ